MSNMGEVARYSRDTSSSVRQVRRQSRMKIREPILKSFWDYLENQNKRETTRKIYVQHTRNFLRLIDKEPSKIDKHDIERWLTYCSDKCLAPISKIPMYGAIKKFVEYLVDKELLDERMWAISKRKLKNPKVFHDENLDEVVFSKPEYEHLFKESSERNQMHYAMFKLMFWGMLRNTETRLLEISDIKWDKNKLKIRGEIAKRGKPATINLSQECIDILKDYVEKYRDKPWYDEDKDILFLRDGVRVWTEPLLVHK